MSIKVVLSSTTCGIVLVRELATFLVFCWFFFLSLVCGVSCILTSVNPCGIKVLKILWGSLDEVC